MTFDPRVVPSARPAYSGQQYSGPQFVGQGVPGPVPPPPSRPSRPRRPLAAKIVAGLVAAGLVAGGAGTWIALSGSSGEAAVQTTSFAGANPTTSPFGTDAPQVATVAATGPQPGDTAGLYAATTPPACTTADFLAQLQADPTKVAAFGGVFGVGSGDVPAFVDSLSPVVLRAATSVTDHPFADGGFVEQPTVLAPGTAVLVNSYGEPTVKCFNGNPLTAGDPSPDAVTVTPTTRAMTEFRFTTVDNSGTVVVPTPHDPKPHPGPNPVSAHYNYDGSVLLSDGRIIKADGTVITPKAPLPAGGVRNADGSVTVGGKTFNPDGTERTAIVIPPQTIQLPVGGTTTVPGFTIRADGVAVDANNLPLAPQPTVIRNYDGTATVISGSQVAVWGTDGSFRSKFQVVPPNKVNPDGSITTPDGRILNPDGSTERTPVTLPNHGTVQPNGGEKKASTTDPKDPAKTEGQTQPAPVTQTCPEVVTDTAATCTPSAGSADSADPKEDPKKATTSTASGTDSTSTSTSTSTDSTKGSDSTTTDSGTSSSKDTAKGGSKN
jgi:uncharacterized protein DUF6777